MRARHPKLNRTTLAMAGLLASLASTPASAASCTWNSTNGNWNELAKWLACVAGNGNPVGSPGAADGATIGAAGVVTINTGQSVLNLNNAGRINIDAFGLNLVGGGSTTNTGTINVGGASTANLGVSGGHNINNTGGVINVGAGSVINQFGSTITGGTINTTGTGALVAFSSGSNFLSGVTLNGVMDMATNGNSRQRISNGLTLNGSVNVANGGILSLDSSLVANQTIGGIGTINLNDAGARLAVDGSGITTLGANVVVRGQGNIGQAIFVGGNNTLVNNGRISADVSTGTLNLVAPANGGGSSYTNNNLMDARGGGTLLISANVNNSAGLINAQNGSGVQLNGVTITGGLLGTSGSTGLIQSVSSASNFLDGVTINGVLDMSTIANSRQRLINTTTLIGSANVGNGGILGLDSSASTGNSAVLAGTGVVNLNDAGARLSIDGTGTTNIASGITVRGQGNIGQAGFVGGNNVLTNNGLISADVSGGTLNIVAPGGGGGSSFVNNGTLQAVGGGTLLLSTNILSNSGSQITAGTGSSVVQNGVTLNGVINVSSGGTGVFTANSSASNFLNATNFTGTLDLSSIANSRERISNGMTLNGTVNIANGGILGLDSSTTSGGNQTLSGTATINLSDAGARLSIDGTGTTTIASGITVRGQGNIGQAGFVGGNNVLTSNGLISSDVNGGTLNIVAPGSGGGSSFVNNGTLQAINGATLLLSTNILSNSGSQIFAGAGSSVVQNGVTLNGVINVSAGAGVFTANSSSSNFLDNATFNGALDLSSIANSRERIINGMMLNGSVNIANGGILSLDSSATSGGNQTLSGTGTINLNDPGARLSIDGTGTTTFASSITVRGQGNIGLANFVGGNNVLTNNGLISADVGGGTLNITAPASGGGSSFVNNGTLRAVNGGTLLLSTNILSTSGAQITAGTGSSVVQNGVTLNGVINVSSGGTGVFSAISSGSNFLDGANFTGALDLASIANARERIVNGITLNGSVSVANGGILSLDSSATTGGNQTIGGTGTINLNDAGARLAVDGSGITTLGANVVVRGQGNIGQANFAGGNNTLVNNGRISADVSTGTLNLVAPANGGGSSYTNNNLMDARGGGTLQISANVNNSAGLINAQNGSLVQLTGVTITGGLLGTSSSTGLIQSNSASNNFLDGVTINGVLDMSTIANSRQRLINTNTLNGSANVGNGGILSLDSASSTGGSAVLAGTGVVNLNDAGARLAIEGSGTATIASGITVRGQGNIGQANFVGGNNVLSNNGLISADVSGGTLNIVAPASGGGSSLQGTGTLQISGGAMNLNTGNASTQGRLVMGASGTLNLNTQNLTITTDYTNAQSGSGNSFDRRAGVSGTGQILAGTNAAQAITGAAVTGGNTTNATLTISNVRVGTTSFEYQIANTGTTGPTLRGAIQTSVNGGNITDARLGGSGVTASNYNAGAPGGNSGNQTITFTAASAGALGPLSSQAINLRSNFVNIADQKLNIVLAGGAAAYNAAVGSTTPTPVALANQRVGGTLSQALTVNNTAAAGAFSEDLRTSFTANSGAATTNGGSINALVAGASNNGAMSVGVNTSTSGAKSGSVTLGYQTSGTVNGVSNGLGVAGANAPQVINVTGNVYQAAAGQLISAPLNFGTVQVGQTVTQNLVVRNTASGAAGFVEDLHASFGAASGTGAGLISGSGSLNGILAGSNSTAGNGVMTVAVNTAAAGVVNGNIAVNYTTAGAVAGVSNNLGTASVGSEAFGVQGQINAVANVINQASPLVNTPTINLGAVRVGAAAPSGTVSVSNVATVAPQAALNASIAATSGPITASGSFALLNPGGTNSSSLVVGLNTGTAGNFTGGNAGTATISLVSDANNVGGCGANCQLNLASQLVNVEGKVYTAAVGSASGTSINFGVVRVGDTVSARNITVNNTAATTALNDTLRADVSGLSGPISGNGSASGIAAQGSALMAVGLNTANAGIFSQSGSVGFTSQNADMADVSAGAAANLSVFAQVNNLANGDFDLNAGVGTLSQTGTSYVLDLGTIVLGNSVSATLSMDNDVTGPADALSGSFDLSGVDDFALAGWNPLAFLGAGQAGGAMTVNWLAGGLGLFTDTIVFNGVGTNASDPTGLAQSRQLVIRANVIQGGGGGNVPEPGTLALLLSAAAAAVVSQRRAAARKGAVK